MKPSQQTDFELFLLGMLALGFLVIAAATGLLAWGLYCFVGWLA